MAAAFTALKDVVRINAQNWQKTWSMAYIQFVKRYSGSALGVVWSLVKPILFILVYWFAIAVGIRGGKPVGEVPYLFWLMPGILPWFFMSDAITSGGTSVLHNRQLVTKTLYPAATIPIFTLVSYLFTHVALVALMLLIFLVSGQGLSIYSIQVVYYMFCMLALMAVVSILFSALSAISRDVNHFLKAIQRVLLWLTPILWNLKELSPKAQRLGIHYLVKLNPMTYIVEGYRDAMIYQRWFTEHWLYTIYFWALVLALALLSCYVFRKVEREFADIL